MYRAAGHAARAGGRWWRENHQRRRIRPAASGPNSSHRATGLRRSARSRWRLGRHWSPCRCEPASGARRTCRAPLSWPTRRPVCAWAGTSPVPNARQAKRPHNATLVVLIADSSGCPGRLPYRVTEAVPSTALTNCNATPDVGRLGLKRLRRNGAFVDSRARCCRDASPPRLTVPSSADPRSASQVGASHHRRESALKQALTYGLGLFETVLDQEPSADMQAIWGTGHDALDVGQSVA